MSFADGYKPGQDSDIEEPPKRVWIFQTKRYIFFSLETVKSTLYLFYINLLSVTKKSVGICNMGSKKLVIIYEVYFLFFTDSRKRKLVASAAPGRVQLPTRTTCLFGTLCLLRLLPPAHHHPSSRNNHLICFRNK